MKSWANGKIQKTNTKINSLNFALHYANPTAWEGIRSYLQKDGSTKIFKLKEHCQRLLDTAKIMGFNIPFALEEIMEACEVLVKENGGGDLYLRPIAYSTHDAESITPQLKEQINLDIYSFNVPPYKGKQNIKVSISGITRSYPHYDMQAKTSKNYHFLQFTKREIEQKGVDDVFLVDTNGHITEALVSNVFVIKGDAVMTPPNDGSILPGITRRCIADILQNAKIMIGKYKKIPMLVEKKITRADLYTADCVLLCGTYAEIVNVIEIDGRKLNGSDYFGILQTEYQNLVRGKDETYNKKSG